MTRTEAIEVIVEAELSALSEDERESLLLDWWSMDEADEEFGELSDLLRAEMKHVDGPGDARIHHYDALLRVALRHRFVGVLNEYLSNRLASLGWSPSSVTGDVEPLRGCVCCGFRTLPECGYDVCPVCFWEEDGIQDPDRVSGPNHMTLREGRENFARLGAVSENATRHVVEGTGRYAKAG
ncbi:CPCC family cysteine-rich protein [Nannocystaceae bacterium ST9]